MTYKMDVESGVLRKADIPLSLFDETNLAELRELGFPYLEFNDSYLTKFEKLRQFDPERIISHREDREFITPYTHFSKLASVFFPEMYETPVFGKNTPMSAWLSDKYLARTLWLCKKNFKNPKYSNLRTVLQVVSGVQCVSNFRPEVAKLIYQRYGNKGTVYDFSMGYGGRLVGFLASDCQHYIGVDVNTANFTKYQRIIRTYPNNKLVDAIVSGSEFFIPIPESIDLAFSSPPYFVKERYSNDPEQSYMLYGDYSSWVDNFLSPTLANAYIGLKPGGVLAINIANIKLGSKSYDLEDQTRRICAELGLTLEHTIYYQLSKMIGIKKLVTPGEDFKYEPIFIFRKGGGTGLYEA